MIWVLVLGLGLGMGLGLGLGLGLGMGLGLSLCVYGWDGHYTYAHVFAVSIGFLKVRQPLK